MIAHRCDSGVFDRTLCPKPCDTMHSYCETCGKRQDPCAFDGEAKSGPVSDVDVAAIREALAKATPGVWCVNCSGGEYYGAPEQADGTVADAELIVLLRNNAEVLLDIAEHVGTLDYLTERVAAQRDRAVDALVQQRAELERAQAASEGVDMLIAAAERRGAVKALSEFAEDVAPPFAMSPGVDETTLERVRWTALEWAGEYERGVR